MSLNLRTFALCFAVLLLALPGCGPRTIPAATAPPPERSAPPPDQPKPPAPTITLEANPSSIERGGQTTLQWQSTNAGSIVIDSGVGNVSESGSIVVSPLESTTYTAVASGPGGQAQASSRVTVVRPKIDAPVVSTDLENLRRAIQEGKIQDVFFPYDKAELSPKAMDTLRENAIWIRRYPAAKLVIEGHCDERGSEEYNLALGDRRALAARDYLIQAGVSPEQLETISYGEERPFDPGHDEASWAKNRRAHFVPR